mmetsp:Transcript_49851/g.131162  ORF Transcript_49851/g.131162 Transcript_49851/m.131162 type:complete len:217 (-) Transcript_49851:108-758(-)
MKMQASRTNSFFPLGIVDHWLSLKHINRPRNAAGSCRKRAPGSIRFQSLRLCCETKSGASIMSTACRINFSTLDRAAFCHSRSRTLQACWAPRASKMMRMFIDACINRSIASDDGLAFEDDLQTFSAIDFRQRDMGQAKRIADKGAPRLLSKAVRALASSRASSANNLATSGLLSPHHRRQSCLRARRFLFKSKRLYFIQTSTRESTVIFWWRFLA